MWYLSTEIEKREILCCYRSKLVRNTIKEAVVATGNPSGRKNCRFWLGPS
jgi:hypothetical protein